MRINNANISQEAVMAQFVINGRSRGHFGDKANLSKAVSLQYYRLRSLAGLQLR